MAGKLPTGCKDRILGKFLCLRCKTCSRKDSIACESVYLKGEMRDVTQGKMFARQCWPVESAKPLRQSVT